ncbi:hypothetical protein CCM_06736 [Cordyceps militaris CM01]|uniref:Uncharacterized protein n=1 Tax=Cordyceps militaris (strain CM01) TaxID=983644 RepID=G3JKU4_CORMM|nr:uncharacterized protein CCM_06736 [Cordyceps militaris CM01]EGX90318.1 hypothetical protein CCM_06736 [Cordyceps militaris CM01]
MPHRAQNVAVESKSVPKANLAQIAFEDSLKQHVNIQPPPQEGRSKLRYHSTTRLLKSTLRRSSSQGGTRPNDVKVVVEGPAYSHLDVSELQDAILQLERETRDQIEKNGSQSYSVKFPRRQNSGRALKGSQDTENDESKLHSKTNSGTGGKEQPFKIIVKDETGILKPQNMRTLLKTILQVRVNFANKIVNDEYTLDSRALLRMAERATRPPLQVSSYEDHLHNLPMTLNKLNIELVRIYLQLLCRFKAVVDGAPNPTNRFMKHWVPLSIKSPLNLQIILYTSACFLNETGQVPKMVVWAHKSAVHKLINEHIAKVGKNLSDEVIMGTAQMVLDSWYWGTTEEMHAHMLGLKSMIKIRGGFQTLGMQGFLAKTVITDDITIALAHEVPASMFDKEGFEFKDEFMVPYQVSFNSPLMSDWPPFASSASTLSLHPNANQLLDDMRNLLKLVLDLPEHQTPENLQKVAELAAWTYQRISMLPENVPKRSCKEQQQQEDLQMHQQRTQQMPQHHGQQPTLIDADSNADRTSTGTSARWDGSSPENTYASSVFESGTPKDEASLTPNTSPARSGSDHFAAAGARPDLMYRVIRHVALIYCRAILARLPTSQVCDSNEFLQIWMNIWEVPLAQWKTILGVYHWITIGLVPSGHDTAPARFSKMLMVVALLSIGLDNWHICIEVSRAALKLQKWLREGHPVAPVGIVGGEAGVAKFGFPIKEDLPAVAKYDGIDFLEGIEEDMDDADELV